MTTIYYVSDLHLEFLTDAMVEYAAKSLASQIKTTESIVILGGDIVPLVSDMKSDSPKIYKLLDALFEKTSTIVYSMGNHDYYGYHYLKKTDLPLKFKDESDFLAVHASYMFQLEDRYPRLVLSGFGEKPSRLYHASETGVINIVNFTDWYSLRETWMIGQKICDYGAISPPLLYEPICRKLESIRNTQMNWVLDNLKELQEGKLILLGHFLPCRQSIDPYYSNSPLQEYFFVDKEDYLVGVRPTFYIHGHTHTVVNEVFEGVKVLANPHGYPREANYRDAQLMSFVV